MLQPRPHAFVPTLNVSICIAACIDAALLRLEMPRYRPASQPNKVNDLGYTNWSIGNYSNIRACFSQQGHSCPIVPLNNALGPCRIGGRPDALAKLAPPILVGGGARWVEAEIFINAIAHFGTTCGSERSNNIAATPGDVMWQPCSPMEWVGEIQKNRGRTGDGWVL